MMMYTMVMVISTTKIASTMASIYALRFVSSVVERISLTINTSCLHLCHQSPNSVYSSLSFPPLCYYILSSPPPCFYNFPVVVASSLPGVMNLCLTGVVDFTLTDVLNSSLTGAVSPI